MKSYSSYTVPEVSSLKDNGIKDLSTVKLFSNCLRLVNLKGQFVRIEINTTDKYVEVKSNKEVDLSKYNKIFESLFGFIYSKGYLFGIVNNDELKIYDAYVNDNFFSSKDLNFLKNNYNLPIVDSIIENVDYKTLMNSIMDNPEAYILPSVYINDKRSAGSNAYIVPITKVIVGKKKEYTYWNGYNNPTNYTPPKKEIKETTQTPSKDKPSSESSREVSVDFTSDDPDDFYTLLTTVLTKEERNSMAKECFNNVTKYMVDNAKKFDSFDLEFFKQRGYKLCYVIGCLCHPNIREYVYDFYLDNEDFYISTFPSVLWSDIFLDIITTYFYDFISYSSTNLYLGGYFNKDEEASFYKIFKNEFENFDKFYLTEYNSSKESK